jgi:hypothetical protein
MNIRLRDKMVLVAVTLALIWCIPSVGQVLKGSISGTVVDPQGAVVSGAQVRATNVATNVVNTTTSDGSGLFRLNLLPVGTYNIDVTAQGFKTSESKGVAVKAGDDTGLGSMHLAIGEASSTLEVTAAAPLVDSTQAQVTNTFSGVTLQTFAGIQEDEGLDRLALFVPGVTSSRSNNFSNTNGASIATDGLRGRNNDQEIDGQNNNDNSVGGPGLFIGDSNFVGQYVIVTNNFGPEYGRNAGSVVNILTKSGTNNWHGSIYGTETNSFLDALTNTQKNTNKPGTTSPFTGPPRSNDEFSGGTIGGPVLKNKVFLFAGFDNDIFEGSNVFTTSLLTPTPAGLAQLAGCGSAINPTALSVLDNFGEYAFNTGAPTPRGVTTKNITNASGTVVCPNVQMGGVTRILSTPDKAFNWTMRSDAQLTSNDSFSARYLFNRNNNFNSNDNGAGGWVINIPALSQATLLSETHNFSSRMVNEARVGFSRLNVEFGGGLNPLEPVAGNLANAFTNISFQQGGFLGMGPATNLPQARLVNTWQAQDNWNWLLGKHNIKAGVNWTYQRSPNTFLPDLNGQFRFTTLSSFLTTDQPNRIQIAEGQPVLDFREYDTFTYFGDDWKIKQNLTLNLGLTWTYFGSPSNLFNQITAARESNPATALWLQSLPQSVTTDPTVPAVKSSFGPSIGFAYNPGWGGFFTGHGKTTIRGGYRLLYDPPFYNIFLNISSSAPETFLQTLTATTTPSVTGNLLPGVPTGPTVRSGLAANIATNTFDPRTQNETTVSNNFGPDKVHEWTFGVEREITKDSAFEARYAGNHALNQYQTVNGNPYLGTAANPGLLQNFPGLIPNASSLTPCATTQQVGPGAGTDVGRVNCGSGIDRVRDNGAFSNYNALQLQFRATNLFKQLTMQTDFTWSKTLDNASEIFSTGNAGNTLFAAQNPFNTGGAEYSTSGIDFPRVWTALLTEQLPFFREQKGALGHLLGGWTISANYIVASGQSYTPVQNFEEAIISDSFLPGSPNYYDSSFVNAFAGVDVARPFFGNPSAPASAVGIFAADACEAFFGIAPRSTKPTTTPGLCNTAITAPNTLVSMNSLNAGGTLLSGPGTTPGTSPVAVTNQQVRFIINGATAQSVFGTPFGNVRRNPLRDAISNIGNASIFKNIKLGERANFEMHLTALNVLNHFNFTGVDVGLEDAGLANFGQGFANPALTSATGRTLIIGGTLTF